MDRKTDIGKDRKDRLKIQSRETYVQMDVQTGRSNRWNDGQTD